MGSAPVPASASRSSSADDLTARCTQLESERDRYRELYLSTLEKCKLLEWGIVAGRKAERLSPNEAQLTLALLGTVLARHEVPALPEPARAGSDPHTSGCGKLPGKPKPTGLKPLPPALPRVEIELIPDEVQRRGLDVYERIGEDVCEVVERRPGSLVVVRTVRPKFVLKGRELSSDVIFWS